MVQGWLQIALFAALLVALVPPLGGYMARVYTGEPVALARVLGPLERLLYRLMHVRPEGGQDWKRYARSILAFSVVGWLALFLILRMQTVHPWNPQGFHSGT